MRNFQKQNKIFEKQCAYIGLYIKNHPFGWFTLIMYGFQCL